MSKKSGWVPIDKCLAGTFKNINRPFSYIEAMFSYTLDRDNGKKGTYRGYAKLWQWSVGKVKRFAEGLENTSGTVVERKGNGSGTLVSFVDKDLWTLEKQKRNSSGTVAEHKRYATTNPNPNPNPKTTKTTTEKPVYFSTELWDALLKNRKHKKLQNSPLALKTFCNSIERAMEAGYTVEECIGEYVACSWKRFDHTWMKKDSNKYNGGNGTQRERHNDIREQYAADLLAEELGNNLPSNGSYEKLGH